MIRSEPLLIIGNHQPSFTFTTGTKTSPYDLVGGDGPFLATQWTQWVQ